eukprot:CAMPEP_0115141880 /NCGR_PEP_ID=MMETSP0227-20121206/59824_1 /TAXON_ID=89957 /ORGANISM="Polarella glacialis, Strain CCMP 1383" /LENGTH=112 /DNA_ID=CAMNT_0002550373 /DNA_START=766 /DNA_END=1101 /DNA_ORIENTATION=+
MDRQKMALYVAHLFLVFSDRAQATLSKGAHQRYPLRGLDHSRSCIYSCSRSSSVGVDCGLFLACAVGAALGSTSDLFLELCLRLSDHGSCCASVPALRPSELYRGLGSTSRL